MNLWVEENYRYSLQRNQGRNVLNRIIILIHTDVGQQIHEMKEIIPLWPPVFVVLLNGTEILFIKSYVYSFRLYFTERILKVLNFIFFSLNLKSITEMIIFVFEKFVKDDVLILF